MEYTVKEIAGRLGISPRAVQTRAKRESLPKAGRSYVISDQVLDRWISEAVSEVNEPVNEANEAVSEAFRQEDPSELITESFTVAEYDKLQEVVHTYPILLERIKQYQDEIQYLRNQIEKKDLQTENLIQSLQQINYLSAMDKKKG